MQVSFYSYQMQFMHSNDYNDMKSRMVEMLIKVLCDLQEAAFELERLNYASYQPVNKSIRPRFCKKCQVRVPLRFHAHNSVKCWTHSYLGYWHHLLACSCDILLCSDTML